MKITIKPSELVKYCIWDNFVYFVLDGNQKEAQEKLKEDKEFELNEGDAYIIGLLKIMCTDRLVFRFNMFVKDYILYKHAKDGATPYIKKIPYDNIINKFLQKFPEDFKFKEKVWNDSLEEVRKYVEDYKEKLKSLEVFILPKKDPNIEWYNAKHVQKLLRNY